MSSISRLLCPTKQFRQNKLYCVVTCRFQTDFVQPQQQAPQVQTNEYNTVYSQQDLLTYLNSRLYPYKLLDIWFRLVDLQQSNKEAISEDFVNVLNTKTMEMLEDFTEADLCQILYPISRLQLNNPELQQRVVALLNKDSAKLSNLSASKLRLVLSGLASLEIRQYDLIDKIVKLLMDFDHQAQEGYDKMIKIKQKLRGKKYPSPPIPGTRRFGFLTIAQLRDVLYSCKQLEYRNVEFLEKVMEIVVKKARRGHEDDKKQFTPSTVSSMMNALTHLKYNDAALVRRLAYTLIDNEQIKEADTFQKAKMIGYLSWAKGRGEEDHILADKLLVGIDVDLHQHEQIGTVLHLLNSFVRMHYRPPKTLELIARIIRSRTRRQMVTAKQISQVLRACSVLEINDRELLETLGMEILRKGKINGFNHQDLSATLFACAKLGIKNKPLIDHLLEAILRQKTLSNITVLSAGNIIYAAHIGEYKRDNLMKSICDAISNNGTLSQDETTLEGLGSFMHALARVQFIQIGVMDAICGAIKRRNLFADQNKGQKTALAASQLIGGLSNLSYRDDAVMTGLCKILSENIKSNNVRTVDVASSIHACARLCYPNPTFMKIALEYLMSDEQKLKDLDAKMLTAVMWSLTVFEVLTPTLFQHLALGLKDLLAETKKSLSAAQLMQVYQAHFFVQATYSENFFGDPELNRMVRDARKHRREVFTSSKQVISDLQKEVLEVMEMIGVPHKREGLIQDKMFQVDIRIENSPAVVEVDGRLHFSCNPPYRPLGHTVLRNRHLEALGWKVITVPGFEWGEFNSADEKKIYLMGKLRDAGVEIPVMPQDILVGEG